LDVNTKEIYIDNFQNSTALKNSLIHFYANRYHYSRFSNILSKVNNLMDFAKYFYISRGTLTLQSKPEEIVVLTRPLVKYNPDDLNRYPQYCYYQLIKYSDWHSQRLVEKENAIEKWNLFLKTASPIVLNSIK
jgi:hypothetical protein